MPTNSEYREEFIVLHYNEPYNLRKIYQKSNSYSFDFQKNSYFYLLDYPPPKKKKRR